MSDSSDSSLECRIVVLDRHRYILRLPHRTESKDPFCSQVILLDIVSTGCGIGSSIGDPLLASLDSSEFSR